jgi:hypothetical protein
MRGASRCAGAPVSRVGSTSIAIPGHACCAALVRASEIALEQAELARHVLSVALERSLGVTA